MTEQERVAQEHSLGKLLAESFEPHLALKNDVEVSVYLRRLAENLVSQAPEIKDTPLGVLTIGDHQGRWRSFGFPGNRIYLSVGLLRTIEYENEIAAVIALELAHILKRHALNHYDAAYRQADETGPILPNQVQYFGPRGIFTYSDEENAEAAETAVDLMYRAGYDPRGLVKLWQVFRDNAERSPYEPEALDRLTERTRQALAMLSPLRNPVVRSEAYLRVQKRIQKL